MSDRQPIGPVSGTWLVVFKKELRDLWIGGKALNLTIAYAVLLGAYSYWMTQDSLQSFTPPKEMVFELMKVVMIVAVFMGLVIGADTLSGERERNTLEGLLLTPTSRVQIVVGKFLAALSVWPAALVITVPYQYALAQGDEVFGQALMWGAFLGTLLVPAFTALGMLVSFWCNSNKSSMFVTIGIYLIFLLPTQLPGHAQGGFMGLLFQALNPLAGTRHFLAGMLVNNRTPAEYSEFVVSAIVFFVATLAALFGYAAPALRLEGGKEKRVRMPTGVSTIAIIAGLLVALSASPAVAQADSQAAAAQPDSQAAAAPVAAASAPVVRAALQVAIDKADTVVRAGVPLLFNTVISNSGAEPTQPVIVAMNIINLNAKGDVVDPEDWSPQRTQYVQPLAPGQSSTLSWRVNAILDGDFMVYMVAIPSPGSPDATSQPVASSGIHLTVTPYTKLNPGGVLPYAIGGPVLLGLLMTVVYRRRRRQIDMGG